MTDEKRGPGRPPLTADQKRESDQRSRAIRAAASLARTRTLMVFKERYPDEFEQIYRQEYEALKATKLSS